MLKKLVKLSEHLYEKGLVDEARRIDAMIYDVRMSGNIKTSQQAYIDEQTFLQPFKDVYDNVSDYFSEENLKETLEKHLCSDEFISPTLALDIAGFFPGLGEPADIANVAIALHCGKLVDAFLSALAVVPIVGVGATILKRLPSKPSTISDAKNIIVERVEAVLENSSAIEAKEVVDSTVKGLESAIHVLYNFQKKAYNSLPAEHPVITNCDRLIDQINDLKKTIQDMFSSRAVLAPKGAGVDELSELSKKNLESYNKLSDAYKDKLIHIVTKSGKRIVDEVVDNNIEKYIALFKKFGVSEDELAGLIYFLKEKMSRSKVYLDESYFGSKKPSNIAFAQISYSTQIAKQNVGDATIEISIYFNMPNILENYKSDILSGNYSRVISNLEQVSMEEIDHAIFAGIEQLSKSWAHSLGSYSPDLSKKISDATSYYSNSFGVVSKIILDKLEELGFSKIPKSRVDYLFEPEEIRATIAKLSKYARSLPSKKRVGDVILDFNSVEKIKDAASNGLIDEPVGNVLYCLLFLRKNIATKQFEDILDWIDFIDFNF